MKTLRNRLWIDNDRGGMARYDRDLYHRVNDKYPGNPWFICTLWYADYLTGLARTEEDLAESIAILPWVADHALPSGVLAEQVNPDTGAPLSVSPLTWSHATYVASARKIMRWLPIPSPKMPRVREPARRTGRRRRLALEALWRGL